MKCVEFNTEEKQIKDFINLPNKIYSKDNNTQNDDELRLLLQNRHPLSAYFNLYKFCIYQNNEIVGRFIITRYEDDNVAYLGFFECVEDDKVAAFLFDNVLRVVKEKDFVKIIGPVDASFWMKYRLKTNMFDKKPYTGEPYNPAYYLKLFTDNGFKILHKYYSSIYRKVLQSFSNEKYSLRKKAFELKGYQIISPEMKDWDKTIKEIYKLISELYSDFPVYKAVCESDFCTYFNNYKKIINLKMVKMAYFNGEAVGFYISVPNYNNLVYHSDNIFNLLKILKLKIFPEEYVMLYMGVDKKHQGLGKALVQSIMEELQKSGLPSIGALQKEGKITGNYLPELMMDRYEYVLLTRDVN